MQGVGCLHPSDTSKLDEPPFSLLLVPLAEPCSYHARAPGKVGESRKRCTYCSGQELLAIVPYPLSHHVLLGGERSGNPQYQVSCLPDRSVPGMAGCSSSSLSPSQGPPCSLVPGWVQSLGTWTSGGYLCSLVELTDTAPFLHARRTAAPCPVYPPCLWLLWSLVLPNNVTLLALYKNTT